MQLHVLRNPIISCGMYMYDIFTDDEDATWPRDYKRFFILISSEHKQVSALLDE